MFHNYTKMYHFLLHKEKLVMNKTARFDFRDGKRQTEIDVREFIMKNFTPYVGDKSFLTAPTQTTSELWDRVMDLTKQERENGGVLDMDTSIVSTITSHGAGFLNKDKER